jgi:hypothetical protein
MFAPRTSLLGGLLTGWLALTLSLAATTPVLAQDAASDKKAEPTLNVTGTVRCTSCDLKKEKNAQAQCSIYGCQFAVRTDTVTDQSGARVKKLEGKTYQVMLNDQSKALTQKEQKGNRFNLKAKIHEDDGVIEVASFETAKK